MANYNYVNIDGKPFEVAVGAAFMLTQRDFKKASGGYTLTPTRSIVPTAVQQKLRDDYTSGRSSVVAAIPRESSHCEVGPNGPTAVDVHDSGKDAGVTVKGTTRWNILKKVSAKWGYTWGGWGVPNYEGWHWENRKVKKGLTGRNASGRRTKDIQTFLKKQGFYALGIDGEWGNGSTAGTMAYQMDMGLEPDGAWGPITDRRAFGNTAVEGVDFSWGRPSASALKSAGKSFVVRYVGDFGGKSTTKDELAKYSKAGLGIVFVYEEDGKELLGGTDAGVRVAKVADASVKALGYPGAVVYFAVDFAATTAQMDAINAALKGAASVIGRDRVGVYGSYDVVTAADAKFLWQTYAWSNGKVADGIHLYQWLNGQTIGGAAVDYTRAMQTQFGQASAVKVADVGTTKPKTKPIPLGRNITKRPTKDVQKLVGATPDGIYGQDTTNKVAAWQKAHKLTADGIWGEKSDAKGFPKPKAPKFPLPKGSYFGPRLPLSNKKSVSGYYSHRADLKKWQKQMKKRGWKITVDGLYGTQTARITKAFQKDEHLTQDSLIGAITWAAAWEK